MNRRLFFYGRNFLGLFLEYIVGLFLGLRGWVLCGGKGFERLRRGGGRGRRGRGGFWRGRGGILGFCDDRECGGRGGRGRRRKWGGEEGGRLGGGRGGKGRGSRIGLGRLFLVG